jgi:hypothetical protein
VKEDDQVSSLSLGHKEGVGREDLLSVLTEHYCLERDDLVVSSYLRAVNSVLANLLVENKFAIGQVIEIHWTMFHNYGKFMMALVPDGSYDYDSGMDFIVEMFRNHTFVDMGGTGGRSWVRHLLKEFSCVYFEGVSERAEKRIYYAIQLMYDSILVLGRVRWVGESLDGGLFNGCSSGEVRVYTVFDRWVLGDDDIQYHDYHVLEVAVGKVRYLHPLDLVTYYFELVYRMGNYDILRKRLENMSGVYKFVGGVLDYFSNCGSDAVVRTFAQMYRGLKYAKVPGMFEVKARFHSLVSSFGEK